MSKVDHPNEVLPQKMSFQYFCFKKSTFYSVLLTVFCDCLWNWL